MNVSSAGLAPVSRTQNIASAREATETPGVPDHDGDGDDTGRATQAKATLPQDIGKAVDKTA